MPSSYPDGKDEALAWIQQTFLPTDPILDVGPGAGIWADRLGRVGFRLLDALEIFAPYVDRYSLRALYRAVVIGDVRDFAPFASYKLVIMGDVLEHLSIADAQAVLGRIQAAGAKVLVSVPWTYPQGAWGGNEAETHLQDDLTPSVMSTRYPTLQPIYKGPRMGVFTG